MFDCYVIMKHKLRNMDAMNYFNETFQFIVTFTIEVVNESKKFIEISYQIHVPGYVNVASC